MTQPIDDLMTPRDQMFKGFDSESEHSSPVNKPYLGPSTFTQAWHGHPKTIRMVDDDGSDDALSEHPGYSTRDTVQNLVPLDIDKMWSRKDSSNLYSAKRLQERSDM